MPNAFMLNTYMYSAPVFSIKSSLTFYIIYITIYIDIAIIIGGKYEDNSDDFR